MRSYFLGYTFVVSIPLPQRILISPEYTLDLKSNASTKIIYILLKILLVLKLPLLFSLQFLLLNLFWPESCSRRMKKKFSISSVASTIYLFANTTTTQAPTSTIIEDTTATSMITNITVLTTVTTITNYLSVAMHALISTLSENL